MKKISRRTALKSVLAGGASLSLCGISASGLSACTGTDKEKTPVLEPLKGNIHHSVSKWCFGGYALDEFCEICKSIGIESIELLDPQDWPIVQKHGLTVAMAQGAGLGIDNGFNNPDLHEQQILPRTPLPDILFQIRNGVSNSDPAQSTKGGLIVCLKHFFRYHLVPAWPQTSISQIFYCAWAVRWYWDW